LHACLVETLADLLDVVGVFRVGQGLDVGRSVRPVVGVAGYGEFVVGQVGWRGLAGAVVVVGGGRVARWQAFQPFAELGVDPIGLAWTGRLGTPALLGHSILGSRHEAISRTFGDRAIVTGDWRGGRAGGKAARGGRGCAALV